MFVTRGPYGAFSGTLGDLGVKVNPNDFTNKPGSGVGPQTSSASTTNIEPVPMTWQQVQSRAQKLGREYADMELAAVRALAPQLNSTCPPSSIKGNYCYDGLRTTRAQMVPGGFEVYGVPFNITEVGLTKSPQFERIFAPNALQRALIENVIVKRSREYFDHEALKAINHPNGKILRDQLSVAQALALMPEWKIAFPNISVRSVSPTQSEFDDKRGLAKWFKRGGFLIWRALIDGRASIDAEAICPLACVSILCKCGSPPMPACIMSRVPTSQDAGNVSTGCFHSSVVVDQSAPWNFRLILKHDDPSWLQKAGGKLADLMTSIGNLFCDAQPVTQPEIAKLAKPVCVDGANKPCVEGSKGCKCIQPSAAAVGGVGLINFSMSKWCTAWKADNAMPPQWPQPPVPDPPPVAPQNNFGMWIPWVLGGLAVGAIAFSRK